MKFCSTIIIDEDNICYSETPESTNTAVLDPSAVSIYYFYRKATRPATSITFYHYNAI